MPLNKEILSEEHELTIVAVSLDAEVKKTINYLESYKELKINVVLFSFLTDGKDFYIARTWLSDPEEETRNTNSGKEWNGEYYFSFGRPKFWYYAKKYGFLSGGGGEWYSRTMNGLKAGKRIWVNIPGSGYSGVATILSVPSGDNEEEKVKITASEFYDTVRNNVDEQDKKFFEDMIEGQKSLNKSDLEYFIKVKWLDSVDTIDKSFKEKRFFGNQNTVACPRVDKWDNTIKRLKELFPKYNQS